MLRMSSSASTIHSFPFSHLQSPVLQSGLPSLIDLVLYLRRREFGCWTRSDSCEYCSTQLRHCEASPIAWLLCLYKWKIGRDVHWCILRPCDVHSIWDSRGGFCHRQRAYITVICLKNPWESKDGRRVCYKKFLEKLFSVDVTKPRLRWHHNLIVISFCSHFVYASACNEPSTKGHISSQNIQCWKEGRRLPISYTTIVVSR